VVIEPSVAHRTPVPKKLGSKIVVLIDPFWRREIYAESGLEARLLTWFIARPDVIEIHEQFRVSYTNGGMPHTHYVDIVVTLADGRRVAYFVKPAAQVAKVDLNRQVRIICETGDCKFHDYRILTELDIDSTTIANSERIVRCGRNFDRDALTLVRDHLRASPSVVTPRLVAQQTGLGTRGSNALIAMLQSKDVTLVDESAKITLDTRFNNFVSRSRS
jgi:hypothetical protein